jgi:hypothetical protein
VGAAQWFDFGTNAEGVTTYRINGHKDDLKKIIDEARDMGFDFWEKPEIERVHKDWTVLLQLFVRKELGYNDESRNG